MTTHPTIPNNAVEAAYAELPSEAMRHVNKARLRAILEAAAPYMLAEAWDAAIEAHKAWTWDDENIEPLASPYRPTDAV